MARFILIDNNTGYIFGDTADLNGDLVQATSPIDACRAVDQLVVGVRDRSYKEVSSLASNETGYRVYRADINGSEAVTVAHDGQDKETIEAVERDCRLVATVRCFATEAA